MFRVACEWSGTGEGRRQIVMWTLYVIRYSYTVVQYSVIQYSILWYIVL